MIAIKIDVTKIDKAKLFPGKNGAKYLDIVLLDSQNDKYGNDYMAVQSVSKEEREAGQRGAILGNGKNIGAPRSAPQRAPQRNRRDDDDLGDIPF
jgi:hypothetical protein